MKLKKKKRKLEVVAGATVSKVVVAQFTEKNSSSNDNEREGLLSNTQYYVAVLFSYNRRM